MGSLGRIFDLRHVGLGVVLGVVAAVAAHRPALVAALLPQRARDAGWGQSCRPVVVVHLAPSLVVLAVWPDWSSPATVALGVGFGLLAMLVAAVATIPGLPSPAQTWTRTLVAAALSTLVAGMTWAVAARGLPPAGPDWSLRVGIAITCVIASVVVGRAAAVLTTRIATPVPALVATLPAVIGCFLAVPDTETSRLTGAALLAAAAASLLLARGGPNPTSSDSGTSAMPLATAILLLPAVAVRTGTGTAPLLTSATAVVLTAIALTALALLSRRPRSTDSSRAASVPTPPAPPGTGQSTTPGIDPVMARPVIARSDVAFMAVVVGALTVIAAVVARVGGVRSTIGEAEVASAVGLVLATVVAAGAVVVARRTRDETDGDRYGSAP